MHVYSAFQSVKNPELLLRGVQKFLNATYQPQFASYEEFQSTGNSRLLYYKAQSRRKSCLFLVPSLINGAEIFDLTQTQSFIRFLLERGVDVYLVNWGDLSAEFEGGLTELLQRRLSLFWQEANNHAERPVHVLGYCLGGTLCASLFSEITTHKPASLTFLATPFDFDIAEAPWQYVLSNDNQVKTQIRLQDALTQRMLHAHFAQLQPEYTVQKFQRFLEMQEDSDAEKCFIAVERWLNGGTDIPYRLSMDLIDTYFLKNNALKALQKLPDIPVAFISSKNDQIVPEKSAAAITRVCRRVRHIQTDCGHVGMMAGRKAKDTVWLPFMEFIGVSAMQQI